MKRRTFYSVSKAIGMVCLISALIVVSPWSPCSWGGEYPERPISVVVAYPPGATDREARLFSPAIEKILGQPMLVENRPGAGSTIGTNYVAQARPDGYTLLFCPATSLTLAPHLRKIPYSIDDFIPVACMTHTAQLLAVSTDAPWKTIQEFIDDAKKNPGKIKFGTAGMGTMVHICGEATSMFAGFKLTMVPFKGMSKAINAMLGGHIDAIFVMPQAILPLVKGGKIRALANCANKRFFGLPDVPAVTEAGIKFEDSASVNWFGYVAPKGTPQPIVDKLIAASRTVITDPEMISKVKKMGGTPDFMPTKEYKALLDEQSRFMKNMAAKLGLVKK